MNILHDSDTLNKIIYFLNKSTYINDSFLWNFLIINRYFFQAWYCSSKRNPKIPKVDGVAHQEITFPTSSSWNRSGFQDRSAFSERCNRSSARSIGSVSGRPVRRHEFVRHSRQTCHNHAKRYTARATNSRWTRLNHSRLCEVFSLYYHLDIVCFWTI